MILESTNPIHQQKNPYLPVAAPLFLGLVGSIDAVER